MKEVTNQSDHKEIKMTRVKVNPIIEQMSGKMGDLVFKRYGDEVVIARAPDRRAYEPSAAQLAARERFRRAAQYGKLALAQPEVRASYEAAAEESGEPLFSLMVADYFKAPVVDELDVSAYTGQIGETIVIQAHDDFEVTGVTVSLKEAGGQAVESGAATQNPPDSGRWVYTTKQTVASVAGVVVTATASDRPGNLGVKTATK
jgi:hypothetical protein